jgi:hypothetical protein
LGFEHWNQVPPRVLVEWCEANGAWLARMLPRIYREAD